VVLLDGNADQLALTKAAAKRHKRKITGARWSLAGAEAILKLRSHKVSHDLDAYWVHHEPN